MKYLFCMVVLAFLPASGQEGPTFSRRVVGYVKDRDNRALAGARVCANPHGAIAGIIPCGLSEANGRFTLIVWWPGTYTISAEDLVEGYANVNCAFYGSVFGELPV